MFHSVKEKRNLLSHSVWSCGDSGTSVLTEMKLWNSNILEISTYYQTNGDKGLKITVNGNASFIGPQLTDTANIIDKTVKFSFDVCTEVDCSIKIMQHNGTTYTDTKSAGISGSSFSTHAEVTTEILSDTSMIWIRLDETNDSWNEGDIIYTDNWCLEEI